jgi:hypothetical protein
MNIFQTTYEPQEWDLVSHRSEGEYFSLSEASADEEGESSKDSSSDSQSSPSSPEHSLMNFLDIKMFSSSFIDVILSFASVIC